MLDVRNLSVWYDRTQVLRDVTFAVPEAELVQTVEEIAKDAAALGSVDARYKAGTPFEPKSGVHTLELAAYYEPSLVELICKIEDGKAKRFPTWQMVVKEAMR